VKLNASDMDALATALQACAHWHGTPEVTLTRTSPVALRTRLLKALRSLA
jgi:hypothetical protein